MERYLMLIKNKSETIKRIAIASEIIDRICAAPIKDEKIEVYQIEFGESPQKLVIKGRNHSPKNPKYIECTDENGNIVFAGIGKK